MELEKPETPQEISENLIHFIARSPSVFHGVHGIKAALLYSGFTEIREEDPWHIEKGGKYVVTRNGSALIAFTVPEEGARSFRIIASHCDSPTFKIKENPEMKKGPYVTLNVEGYGGMIMSTWLDRPLSVAGRLIVRENGHLAEKLAAVDGTMLVIPSVAIHMDRNVNHKKDWNIQTDLSPLYGMTGGNSSFLDVVAASAGVKKEDILAHDLYLYSRVPGTLWGEDREFISSPKLDDLQCAFAAFRGFVAGKKEKAISLYALFDNEEVGSGTANGAGSTFLSNILLRLSLSLGYSYDETMAMIAGSFMISADNAHSVHPNHEEYADPVDACDGSGQPIERLVGLGSLRQQEGVGEQHRGRCDDPQPVEIRIVEFRRNAPNGQAAGLGLVSHRSARSHLARSPRPPRDNLSMQSPG